MPVRVGPGAPSSSTSQTAPEPGLGSGLGGVKCTERASPPHLRNDSRTPVMLATRIPDGIRPSPPNETRAASPISDPDIRRQQTHQSRVLGDRLVRDQCEAPMLAITIGGKLICMFHPFRRGAGFFKHDRPRDAPLLSRFLLWRIGFVSVLFMLGTFGIFEYAIVNGRASRPRAPWS